MLKLNKLKALGFAAMLNAAVLTGCTAQQEVSYEHGPATVYTYEDNDVTIEGKISFKTIHRQVRIIKLSNGEDEFYRLVCVGRIYNSDLWSSGIYNSAIDLATGDDVIATSEDIKVGYITNDGYELVDMQPLVPYLIEDDNVKEYYEVQEVVDTYDKLMSDKGLDDKSLEEKTKTL